MRTLSRTYRSLWWVVAGLFLGLFPQLARAQITFGGSPQSSPPWNLIVDIAGVSQTTAQSLSSIPTTDPTQMSSLLQIQFPNVAPGNLAFDFATAQASAFPMFATVTSFNPTKAEDPSTGYSTVEYVLEIQEAVPGFFASHVTSNQLQVTGSFNPPGGSPISNTVAQNLNILNFIINAAPTFPTNAVEGTMQSLIVNWSNAAANVAALPASAGNQPPSSVVVYVIDLDVGTPTTLPCNIWEGGSSTTPASGTTTTPTTVTPDKAEPNGCEFTPPTGAGGSQCIKFPNTGGAGAPDYLDYGTMSANISANQNTIPGLVQIVTPNYTAGNVTIGNLTNGHHYVVFMQYEPKGTQTSECVVGIPVPNFTLTELNGAGSATIVDFRCFIATAAYGSPLAPELHYFRKFRSRVLLQNPVGRAFVHYYYEYSPPLAAFIARHETLRKVVRLALEPVAAVLKSADDLY